MKIIETCSWRWMCWNYWMTVTFESQSLSTRSVTTIVMYKTMSPFLISLRYKPKQPETIMRKK